MGKNKQLKKLRERVEKLEFVINIQQDIIADFEYNTGECLSKQFLPETFAKKIENKIRKLLK